MAARDVHLQYDASLPHQLAAVDAVVDLFEGAFGGAVEVEWSTIAPGQLDIVELGFANPAPADDGQLEASLLRQLQMIQRRNGLEVASDLDGRHFTVEMETGSGKTYVYQRSIFELHQRFGLTKFVIVVPSVAIREGVLASISSMGPHFQKRYASPIDYGVYESKRLSLVRQFATSSTLQLLVMNIQAFQKDAGDEDLPEVGVNVINRPRDSMAGRKPIEFIQGVRPIVVLDEPQNFESDAARDAINRLNPLCTLRYSATPRRPYNLVYRLGPVEAFQQRLVKEIEVDGVEADPAFTSAHVRLLQVDVSRNRAQVEINAGTGEAARRAKVWVKRGDDLAVRARGRPEYRDGFIVDDIAFALGEEGVEFTGGTAVSLGALSGQDVSEVQRMQIRETIRYHLERERALAPRGIKVLSLFFLDAVADYRIYEADGESRLGPVGTAFVEEVASAIEKQRFADLAFPSVDLVHDGYFSQDAKGRAKDSTGVGETDRSAYEKIMRGKEQLLSLDEPLRFIFTHSALREGWDNPNVFQVCTLTHARSAITRRQQIGRGLRLPVDQAGARVHDREVARLTVIANESYDAFARGLQLDYETETGQTWGVVTRTAFSQIAYQAADSPTPEPLGPERSVLVWNHLQSDGYLDAAGRLTDKFAALGDQATLPTPAGIENCSADVRAILDGYDQPPVRNARHRHRVEFRKAVTLDPGFKALWADIAGRTRYRVEVDSDKVVEHASKAIREMEGVPKPLVRSEVSRLSVTGAGITAGVAVSGGAAELAAPRTLPDVLGQLQNATDLTRVTLARILNECGRADDFRVNPHAFIVEVTQIVRRVLSAQLVEGIEYEPVEGAMWEMRALEPEASADITRYVDRLYEIGNIEKTPYSHVEWESSVEHLFAERLDHDSRVKFFIKLPDWFTVDTPVGPYNPDWAVCWDAVESPRIHLVRETKSTADELARRGIENAKIACAKRHFEALGTDYRVATSFDDLVTQIASVRL